MNSSKFFSKKREVIDALSLIGFLSNPYDTENLLVLLRSPWARLSDEFLISHLKPKPYAFWDKIKVIDHPVINSLKSYLTLSENKRFSCRSFSRYDGK